MRWLLAVLATGCFAKPGPPGGGDDQPYPAAFTMFHDPVKLDTGTTDRDQGTPALSDNELELYYTDSSGVDGRLYRMRRSTKSGDWTDPQPLGGNLQQSDPTGMPGGLEIYFTSGAAMKRFTRTALDAAWEPASGTTIPTVQPFDVSPDGLHLVAGTSDPGDPTSGIAEYTREDTGSSWSQAHVVVSSQGGECCPTISADGLELFWEHHGQDRLEVWRATRANLGEPFTGAALYDIPGLTNLVGDPELSADGRDLYVTYRPDSHHMEVWVAHREPLD